ncbi:MAG TPA: CGNR zinc finger domain-containing protein [Streptosporangiaceae bacterium]|nr:CGNR zinc finger domain-containing protein [Streptosporangiaceae bacterium]
MNLSSYAELAVRLANTAVLAEGEPDPLASVDACTDTLSDCIAGKVTHRDLTVLSYLRTEFASIFTSAATGEGQEAVERLNALLVQFPIQPELVSHDEQRWHVHLAPQGSASDQFAAGAIIGLALTISLYGVSRLGICATASCPRVFVDSSSNASRRYCAEHGPRGNVSTLRAASPAVMPGRTTAAS